MVELMIDAVLWSTLCAGFWWVGRLQERIACLEVILFERSEPVERVAAQVADHEETVVVSDQFPRWE